MNDEVNDFFSALSTGEEEKKPFDISKALEEQAPKESQESEQPSQEGDNTPVEEDLPFHKNPKLKRFIERQAEKIADEKINKKLSEAPKPVENKIADDVPNEYVILYGEQAKQVWDLQKPIFEKFAEQAKAQAINEVQSSFQKQVEAEKQFESFITNSLESIEDAHGVDLTSNTPVARKARSEFLDMVKRLSPKDSDGQVTSYADFNEVWSLYKDTQKKEPSQITNQKKMLSSKTMSKSNETKVIDPNSPRQPISFDNFSW